MTSIAIYDLPESYLADVSQPEDVRGGIAPLGAALIVTGVIFVAGVADGILESYNDNK